jgi:LAO/AO transport system kinase
MRTSDQGRGNRVAVTESSLADAIRAGDRRSLARAITLAESTRPDHREEAVSLLDELLPATGGAIRVGISGAPGAGKSTFIEALGLHLVDHGHRLAVLAVDPSSSRSGGSILGDKTRMEMLSRRPEAFIRPSPSGGTLGGVARRTREALLLCEAAGHDVVLVETVGVGQSEIAVAGMVDVFVLLLAPGAGDDLQGVKRGIVELADVVVVNKADGDLAAAAERTAADYANALHFLRPRTIGWEVRVERASALLGEGIDRVWSAIEAHATMLRSSGVLSARRAEQAREWMWSEVNDGLLDALAADPAVASEMEVLEDDVRAGTISPAAAAQRLLKRFLA